VIGTISKKRNLLLLLCTLCALTFSIHPVGAAPPITNYHALFSPFYDAKRELRIAIRQYTSGSVSNFLVLNPYTLTNEIRPADTVNFSAMIAPSVWKNTPFYQSLEAFTAAPYKLSNYGLTCATAYTSGIFLTIDMCQSNKNYEQGMFQSVIKLPQRKNGPIPVAIALTGKWANQHPTELAWILQQIALGNLDVTWVNHSYSHPYDPKAPLNKTFMLTPGIDFQAEVLQNEIMMLERGMIPAPFFRFPGLISAPKLIQTLKELSLLPIGSNAWLALGQTPRPGSIILVHGNGNEPVGIKLLLAYLRDRQPELQRGELKLLPLREAFSGSTDNPALSKDNTIRLSTSY
jgi:hypothetical protein